MKNPWAAEDQGYRLRPAPPLRILALPFPEACSMMRSLLLVLLLLPTLARSVVAQSDRWQLTLDDDQYVWDIRLVRLEGDSLVIRQSDSLVRVPLGHVNEVRLIRGARVEVTGGAATAGAMSALMGGDDEIYDLAPLEPADRRPTIEKILQLHPPQP